ncbi:ATP-dependent DNA helicase RecG [Succinivibrio faecicola]|uniref:Probable DNA 3'-5' helicase RecG n=2 Tax=Succinivibrio TaxID=83770 RepID=A0ABS7DF63_9GAMM|nr:ATP-dependent DNA helicase RecG [Succinivibrio faecicola]MBW7569932.1 ATP-dependent DNA helicase RecG [Succinivibrio faecicola]
MVLDNDSKFHTSDISTIKGLGPRYVHSFYKKGIFTLFDLLLDLPFRYLDKTKLTKIADAKIDGSYSLIDAHIVKVNNMTSSRSRIFKLGLQDETGYLEAVFFNLPVNFTKQFQVGGRYLVFGCVKFNDFTSNKNIVQPNMTRLNESEIIQLEDRLSPVYHAVEKTPQAVIKKVIHSTLETMQNFPFEELLDNKHNPFKISFNEALYNAHYPVAQKDSTSKFILQNTQSFKRLCFEELVAYQLTLICLKKKNETKTAYKLQVNTDFINLFIKSLPFSLTPDQMKVFSQIADDLSLEKPMLRLLHGDVGSGKTLVAVMSMLICANNQKQSVLLAPTEILAKQHYNTILKFTSGLNIETTLLTGSLKAKQRAEALEKIRSGKALIIVGTHSLFQPEVEYKELVFSVIDEQHRFGIDQRVALLKKAPLGKTLHQLVMTATPIPRTLQLALFSDLDVSTITTVPKGRKPIKTVVMSNEKKDFVISRLNETLKNGNQVYWVCPNIEATEDNDESVTTSFNELKNKIKGYKVGLLHGQMSSDEKDSVMQDFLDGKISVLVATSIIEVGVDVPNANIIIIEKANRFGLAQLHQLRGRVGRGSLDSSCVLLYDKEDCTDNETAVKRLQIMRETTDGFVIATEDLKLRGPGDVIGQRQSGFDIFKLVDVRRDFELINDARSVACDLIENDIEKVKKLIARWFKNFNL